MAPLGPGDPLPDLPLAGPSGKQVSLVTVGGEGALLIFLRHLA
jgi:peroxiredoxin